MSCLPLGYLPAEALQDGMVNDGAEGIGPSFEIEAQAVRLAPSGEWIAPQPHETISALLVDLSSELAPALATPDLSPFGGIPFSTEDPGLFPLASDVLLQAREWAAEFLLQARSGLFPGPAPKAQSQASHRGDTCSRPGRPSRARAWHGKATGCTPPPCCNLQLPSSGPAAEASSDKCKLAWLGSQEGAPQGGEWTALR